jgi:tetratricopeptide (TPR) repeat protein
MSCLDDALLLGLLEGTLDPQEVARVDAHIDGCAACRSLVADLMLARSSGGAPANRPAPREAPAPASVWIGRRYLLLGLLGQGGMGSVHRALDRLTGETVALKRVPQGAPATRSASSLAALALEFRALSALRHPNIISVLDYGFDAERRPYFTMELLDAARPVLPLAPGTPMEARVELLVQILRALAYLHHRGTLHCDLKPSNILVAGGALKVLDFGLSADGEGARRDAVGTLPYMAPELFRGGAPSKASDVYAVGVLACELLAERHPFGAVRAPAELIARVLGESPDLGGLPPALRASIGRALRKAPGERPPDAAAFLRALAEAGVTVPGDPAPARDSYLVAARFTGRAAELGRLAGALDAACKGRGSAWLVGGESGVGKSRLLDELRSRALVEGVLVARGQALAGSGAYHVWRDVLALLALHVDLGPLEASVLAALLPNLSALLDREVVAAPELDVAGTRARLLGVLREVIVRSRDPVLVLLEDLQWADADSLALLAQVSADLGRMPLVVAATYRDDEAPRLPAALPAMEVLHVTRFDRAGVADLCAAMLGPAGRDAALVDLVARETEGNTYFVVEVVRALAEESGGLGAVGRRELPARILAGGVEQVFARRLARVPAEARAFLDLAAVAGRYLDLDVLARCAPRLDALVQAAADAGVLEVHEQRWRFGHDKLRERVLREIDPAARRALHGRVADSLEAAVGAARAAEIAHHHREAGRRDRAARWYALAGEAALARGAAAEAEAMLEQAIALHRHGEVSRLAVARVHRGLAQARHALGRLAETDAAIRRVGALAGTPLPEGALSYAWTLGRQVAEHAARRAGLARRLRLGPRSEIERALQHELLLALGVGEVYVWLVRPEMVLLTAFWGLNLEEALDTRERTNFRAATAFVLSYTPLSGLVGRYLAQAAETATPGTHAEVDYLRIQALIHLGRGRWAEAAAEAEQAVARARALRDDHALLQCLLQLQLARSELDAYASMLETCLEMEQLAARTANARYTALAHLGQGHAWLRLGDLARAEVALDRARATLPKELGSVPEAIFAGLAAECALKQGRRERAQALAREAVDAIGRTREGLAEVHYALACILEVLVSAEDPARHAAWIRPTLARLHRIARRFPFAEPNAWLLQGRYDAARGRTARAVAGIRRSLRAAERLGSRYQEAHARYWLGRLAASAAGARHVPEGAAVHLREALALFERLGCAWETEKVRAAL